MADRIKKELSTEPVPGADYQPRVIQLITTLEQLRAISDPLRLSIVEIISKKAMTVKQIAAALKQPPTKLYYHVSELEAAGVVTLVGTRVKSGIVEKYYRNTAEGIQVDRTLFSGKEGDEESFQLLINTVFDTTIADLTHSFKAGRLIHGADAANPETKVMMLSHDLCHLRREDVPFIIDKFKTLLAEMDVKREDEDLVTYACTIAFFPHEAPNENRDSIE